MASFILIHGAWHGGWCWERIVPLLKAKGHEVLAPDLPGMGADTTPIASLDLAAWAEFVAELTESTTEPAILVGHSRGGIVISEAAERAPARIKALVYLAAFLVPSGKNLLEASRDIPVPEGPPTVAKSETSETTTVLPEAAAPTFYNTTEPSWAARAESMLCPEPIWSFKTPLQLTEARFGSVKRAYIECLQDKAVTIDLQRHFRKQLPCAIEITMDTDHSPFYSAPEELAARLEEIAATA